MKLFFQNVKNAELGIREYFLHTILRRISSYYYIYINIKYMIWSALCNFMSLRSIRCLTQPSDLKYINIDNPAYLFLCVFKLNPRYFRLLIANLIFWKFSWYFEFKVTGGFCCNTWIKSKFNRKNILDYHCMQREYQNLWLKYIIFHKHMFFFLLFLCLCFECICYIT